MRDWLGPRFGVEVATILAVAAVLLLVEASWPAVFAAIFSTWLLIAVFELAMSRRRVEPPAGAAPSEHTGEPVDRVEAVPASAPPEAAAAAPEAEAAPEIEEAREPEAETEVEPGAEAGTGAASPAVEEAPPKPLLTALPSPSAEPAEAADAGEPAAVEAERVIELRPQAPREWNVWELERLAREQAGSDAARDEEWSYLFMYLREFASADGSLPLEFDGLVRESFRELLAVAR